jgi:uncharacterized RDD family membrane protein YckC
MTGSVLFEVITAEKVPFTYRVAGMGSRFLAWLVDAGLMILWGVAGFMVYLVLEIGRAGLGGAVFLLWLFALSWFYFTMFEWLWHGQTPGKWLLGIRALQWQGTSLTFFHAMVRNVVRWVDALPFFYALGFLVAAGNRYQQRLGDFAAATLVVHVDRKPGPIRVLHEGILEAGDTFEAAIRQRLGKLRREQKQTLLDLCLRREQLRIADRAQMFRVVAEFCKQELDLAPMQHESDEKFVVRLTGVLGASLTAR